MGRNKLVFGQMKQNHYLKNKRILVKLPIETREKIKPDLFEKYELKSFQAIFDYVVVGGCAYLNRDILQIVDDNIQEYIERDKQTQLSRLGKVDPPKYPEYKNQHFSLYAKDHKAFKDYVVEKNYRQQWVIEILFREFAKENKAIIDFIQRGQKLELRKRRKQVARLSQDKWIKSLSQEDKDVLLKKLTEKYDNGIFGEHLQSELNELLLERARQEDPDLAPTDPEEEAFLKRMASDKARRRLELQKVSAPREIFDDEG